MPYIRITQGEEINLLISFSVISKTPYTYHLQKKSRLQNTTGGETNLISSFFGYF
jgi:hypothetical protein